MMAFSADTSVSKNFLVSDDELNTWDLFASSAAKSLLRRGMGYSMEYVAELSGQLADAMLRQRRQRYDPKVQAMYQERQALQEVATENGASPGPTSAERRQTL